MQEFNIFLRFIKRICYYYPFTLIGTLLLVFACLLLWNALTAANPFSFILAVSAFALLGLLAGLSRAQAVSAARLSPEWDSITPLYAGAEDGEHLIYCQGLKVLPFYRTHFMLRGRFRVAQKEAFLFFREFSSINPERVAIPLYFPLCGSLEASGYLLIKDIFGFTRTRFSPALQKTIIVQPPRINLKGEAPFITMDGLEDTVRKKDSSEERYYQREYMAGDKLRDINWKVSERIATLITKVSHITQEKTHRLLLFFRNYRARGRESLESLVHLNVIKGWLVSFIRSVKQAHPDFNFEVITVDDKVVVESQEDIERLSLNMSTLTYADTDNNLYLPHPGQVFIFTTPFDTQLARLAANLPDSKLHVFCTAAVAPDSLPDGEIKNSTFSLLKPLLYSSLPGLWALRREKKLPPAALPLSNSITVEKKMVTARLL